MRTQMNRAVPAAAAFGALAFALAACANTGAGTSTGAGPQAVVRTPALGPISAISSPGQITRPIDPYLPTPAQAHELEAAAYAVTARCMAGYGLTALPTTPTDFVTLARQAEIRNQLYGFFDPAVVASEGYDVLVQAPATRGVPSAAQVSVLTGRTEDGAVVTSYQGRAIPSGGCHQVALNAIGGWPPVPGASGSLPGGGPQAPLTDPRVVRVDAEWSACMKSKGYAYATPADAYADARWRPAPGASPGGTASVPSGEIATASADQSCKQATDLMGIAVAVQTAYDEQYVASHATELAAYKQRLEDRVGEASRLLAAGGRTG